MIQKLISIAKDRPFAMAGLLAYWVAQVYMLVWLNSTYGWWAPASVVVVVNLAVLISTKLSKRPW